MNQDLNQLLSQPAGSIPNLFLDNLDVLDAQSKQQALTQILSKISKGGIITLKGVDATLFAKNILNGNLNLDTVNNIFNQCKSIDSMLIVENILINSGFEITNRNIENVKYVLTGRHKLQ